MKNTSQTNRPHSNSKYFFSDNIVWFEYDDYVDKEGILIEGVLYVDRLNMTDYITYYPTDPFYVWIRSIANDIRVMPDTVKQLLNNIPEYEDFYPGLPETY